MRIGNNEKIVLSLMKKYKKYDEKELHILFLYTTQKKARVDIILHSLRIKGFLDKKNKPDFSFIEDTELPSISLVLKFFE